MALQRWDLVLVSVIMVSSQRCEASTTGYREAIWTAVLSRESTPVT